MLRTTFVLALILLAALATNCSDDGGVLECTDKSGEGFTCHYYQGLPVGTDSCSMGVVYSCNVALEWWSDTLSAVSSVEFVIPVHYSAWYHRSTAGQSDTIICKWDYAFHYDGEGPGSETAPISGERSCNCWKAVRRIGWRGSSSDTLWSMSLVTDSTYAAKAYVKMQDGGTKVYTAYLDKL
jgi:hypothetical protein